MTDRRPRIDKNGVGYCDEDNCPSYDGKHCEHMGCRPSAICEPWAIDLAQHRQVCSFCGKTRREVRKLITCRGVYICNECIEQCVGLIGKADA